MNRASFGTECKRPPNRGVKLSFTLGGVRDAHKLVSLLFGGC